MPLIGLVNIMDKRLRQSGLQMWRNTVGNRNLEAAQLGMVGDAHPTSAYSQNDGLFYSSKP